MLAAPALHAQTPPSAAGALRDAAPRDGRGTLPAPSALALPPVASAAQDAPASAAGPKFILRQVRFSGNSVFSAQTLAPLVADQIGRLVGFAELQALAARITDYYHGAGYVLTQVVLPPQDVNAGQVEFSVVEGRLGQVRLERVAEIPMPESAIRSTIDGLQRGQPLNQLHLERAMLLLSDLPGLAPQSSLESGNQPGTFDLAVELKPGPRANFSVDVDNYGSNATGEYRLGGFARLNSPFKIGDNLDARLLTSSGSGLTFGRIGYEAPLGYDGLRAGVAIARLDYALGKELDALNASGRADVFELSLTYPLLRSRQRNLFARLGFEHKDLNDRIGVVAQSSDKTIRSLGAGVVYDARDKLGLGGYTSAALTAYYGNLKISSAPDLALDQAPGGLHTEGDAIRLVYHASRLQSVSAQTSVLLALSGQWASHNLDSAEQLAAGGPRAVRAYTTAVGLGDEVHVLNAEYRWSFRPEAAASLFYDAGWVRAVHHDALPGTSNRATLRAYGLNMYWDARAGLSLRASLAWPGSARPPGESNRNPRLYAQVVQSF
jgi:hemolysin activation/secretion protein